RGAVELAVAKHLRLYNGDGVRWLECAQPNVLALARRAGGCGYGKRDRTARLLSGAASCYSIGERAALRERARNRNGAAKFSSHPDSARGRQDHGGPCGRHLLLHGVGAARIT